jgi:hypothetical protein
MDVTTAFDRRLEHVPDTWKGPLVDVMDTFECVSMWFQGDNEKLYSPELALGLTRLVIEQHAKEHQIAVDAIRSASN